MADETKPAWELEQEARAINATDWEPLPDIVMKRQCDWCHYFFAAPAAHSSLLPRPVALPAIPAFTKL